jgi:hypothetical protein
MKLKLIADNGTPTFVIKYDEGDWELLKRKYEELGLKEAETSNGYGLVMPLKYFKDINSAFSNTLRLKNYAIYNDINQKFWIDSKYVNIAMLRIIPTRNEVKIPLDVYPTISDIKVIAETLSKVLKASLETLCNMEVSIVIKKNEHND